jgi:anti-sigma factor RsiW
MNPGAGHKEVQAQLSAYLDNELTQAEAQRVRIHLEDCADCARALDEMSRISRMTGAMPVPDPPEERFERLERSLSVQAPRQTGWILILAGVIAWLAYFLVVAIKNMRMPTPGEAAMGAIYAGFVLLFVSVIRQRILEYRHDRYRRVKR